MKINIETIIIIILTLALIVGSTILNNQKNKAQEKYELEVKLNNALSDSLRTYKNTNDELVYEKYSLQATNSQLEEVRDRLTENQKRLVDRVNELKKDKDVFAAALIQQKIVVDSLIQVATSIDTLNNTITFDNASDTIKYNITVLNTIPAKGVPTLQINKLEIPNEVFVEFNWEDGELYPVSFSVTNSNPIFSVNDIDSYVIPELQKEEIDPTKWMKIKNWFKENGKKVGIFLGGAIIGGLVVAGSN